MIRAAKYDNLALSGEVSRRSESLQICLGARICEADFGDVEAGADCVGERVFSGYGSAEI